jgi:hypothetical protein
MPTKPSTISGILYPVSLTVKVTALPGGTPFAMAAAVSSSALQSAVSCAVIIPDIPIFEPAKLYRMFARSSVRNVKDPTVSV